MDQAPMRPSTQLNLVAAVAFVLGGSLFALGAAFAQLGMTGLSTINVTYLVGGCFFSLGGYVSILLANNTDTDERTPWCFAVGGVIQAFDTPTMTRTAVQP